MNFDNLVEDIRNVQESYVEGSGYVTLNRKELIALITQYILADRSESVPEGCMWCVTKGGRTICQPPKHAQPTPAQIAEKEEARNWRRWQEAQDYVAKELPEGFRIVMNMAQDDWYISLYDIDDKDVEFDSGDNSSHAITNAVNVAISMNKGEPL